MDKTEIEKIASDVRRLWESGAIATEKVAFTYRSWLNRLNLQLSEEESIQLVTEAIAMFPTGCCGLASCVLAEHLDNATIVRGYWKASPPCPHTWISVGELMVDITADQFGGPPVFVGPLEAPWSLEKD